MPAEGHPHHHRHPREEQKDCEDSSSNDGGSDVDAVISDEHRAAMAGWKARKEQLYRQKESVDRINDEAEKVNLVSLSKEKKDRPPSSV